MLYSVTGVAAGTEIDCGRYGKAIAGQIEREDQVTFLRAMGFSLIDAAQDLPENMVTWYTPNYGVADGYGSSAEHMMNGLERLGYELRVDPNYMMSSPGVTHIQSILERPYQNGSVRIAYVPPHPMAWKRRHPMQAQVGFSMWEDSSLPSTYDAAFHEADAVCAPSTFCVKIFQDRLDDLGIDKRVHLVPLGVDVSGTPFKKRSFDRKKDLFTVVHSASRSSEQRKGADIAFAAFQKAFSGDENVRLILRSRIRSYHQHVGGDPRVHFLHGVISDETRAEIFHMAHVMLYPSRGEGFGLIPLEAIATGLPAIVSDGSGMSDYRQLFVPIETSPVASQISVAWRKDPDGFWHEPDVDVAAAQLRRVYENYEAYAHQAAEAADIIRRDWTFDRTAAALKVAIEDARACRARDLADNDREDAWRSRQHAIATNS